MIEEIIGTVTKYAEEKVKLSKGVIAAVTVGAFIIGLISGAVAARLALSRKLAVCSSAKDEFDADEYVRNLNFDDEE